jgi:ferric-dicitrate binding protein FerR (iron transport regulator)
MKTVKKQPVLDMNDIAWKTRVIDLSNTPLPEVAALLQQTYHREVIVSPGLQNCTITVRFENLDLDSVLEVLQSTLDLTFTTEGKTIVIRGRGC